MIDCIEQATRLLDDLDPNASRLDEFEVNPLARKVLAPLDLQRKDWQTHMILADTLALYDLLPPLLKKQVAPLPYTLPPKATTPAWWIAWSTYCSNTHA